MALGVVVKSAVLFVDISSLLYIIFVLFIGL